MKHLLAALESAVHAKSHYAALAIALALPDICGWVQDPKQSSKERCVAWFEKYMKQAYTRPATKLSAEHVFLGGSDFYALRCAYLHEGRDQIVDQRAQQVLESFQFVVPPTGSQVHCNQFNDTLQLQVDIFCRQVAEGTSAFLANIASNEDAVRRLGELLLIRDVNGNPLPIAA